MAEMMEVYKCDFCGNIVEVLHGGIGSLVCCKQDMKLLDPKTADSSVEKHVPVIERDGDHFKVKVGSVPHPMTEDHYIEWIEIVCDECGKVLRRHLKPGDDPEAVFCWCEECCQEGHKVHAREYCSVHGLWKS